jgi:putative ABC transport system permease protein
MTTIYNDIKYAFRQLRKNPGFTVIVVLVLAVGIGANTTIFTAVNMWLNLCSFSPGESDRLVNIVEKNRPWGIEEALVSQETFLKWQQQCQSFAAMACSQHIVADTQMNGQSQSVTVSRWSPDVLKVLGIQPRLGRTFTANEDQPGKNHVALLTSAYWRRQYSADPNVIGRTITLDHESYCIIGVLPPHLGLYDMVTSVWVPLPRPITTPNHVFLHMGGFMARLKPGVSLEQANAEVQGIAQTQTRAFDHATQDWTVIAQSYDREAQGFGKYGLFFQIPAFFVLLIACSNAASMILARGLARQQEISIRLAVGASRSRIMRQLLTESLLYAFSAGLFGIALAYIGVSLLHAWTPPQAISLVSKFIVDARVLWFTVGISTATGILCGLFPALQLSRKDLNTALKAKLSSLWAGWTRSRFLNGLVIAEIASSVILLVSTGLLVRSVLHIQQVELGFNPHHLLAANIELPQGRYPTQERQRQAIQTLIDQCRALPGIDGVTLSQRRPYEPSSAVNICLLDDQRTLSESVQEKPQVRLVNSQYFSALGIAIKAGRGFTLSDEQPEARSIVINEYMAKLYWPSQNPVGQYVTIQDKGLGVHRIVGVVSDVVELGPKPVTRPRLYLPIQRSPEPNLSIILKTSGDPTLSIPVLRNALIQCYPDLKPQHMGVLRDIIGDSMAIIFHRSMLSFVGVLSVVALVLAGTGMYGIMAYITSQRTQEIGIRLALGAHTHDILNTILKNGLRIIALGLFIGCILALSVAQLLRAMLYEVNPSDPITLIGVSLLLAIVALWACYVPARRAAKVNPVDALHYE